MPSNMWVEKLTIECIDEEDGTMTIHIHWDEKDPDLKYWTDLGEEGQKSFIMESLTNYLEAHVD